MPAAAMTTSARSISSSRESSRSTPATPTSGTIDGRDAQVLEGAARLLGDRGVGGPGRHDRDRAVDVRHGLAHGELERRRIGVVVGAPGQGRRRHLLPHLRSQPRHEDVVRPESCRQISAICAALFPCAEHDLREADAPQAVEVERVVWAAHLAADCIRWP